MTKAKSNGKGAGAVKAETVPVAIQLPKEVHAAFRAKIDQMGLGYSNQSVGKGLIQLWNDGKVTLPEPPEKIEAELKAELDRALASDPAQADKIKRFLADLNKLNQAQVKPTAVALPAGK